MKLKSSFGYLQMFYKNSKLHFLFYRFANQNFCRSNLYNRPDDIRKKLDAKWKKSKDIVLENAHLIDKLPNEDLQDLLKRYVDHVTEREKRRLNFNRKDRWKQRELDDIIKNFDVQQAKFKDYSKLAMEAKIINIKEFSCVDEIYYYLEELLKEGFLEDHIGMALDVFIRDIKFFKSEDLESKSFKKFISELSKNIISLNKDSNIYKTAKFLDWYNIDNKNCWYNLERVIVNKKDDFCNTLILKTLDHFSNQNEGSIEFYDMYQYLFWCDRFKEVKNSEYISLGYNLYITNQGYSQFYFDYYKQLMPRISNKDDTYDLLKIVQTYSEISEYYFDVYKKLEEIILSRYEQLELHEVTVLACGFAISGLGSKMLFEYFEKFIVSKFNELDKNGFREVVRALVVSLNGSKQFFQLVKYHLKNNIDLFNLTEKVYIMKCFNDKMEGDKQFNLMIEHSLTEHLLKPNDLLLEELCAVVDCFCYTKKFSREFQKLLEHVIAQRAKDIIGNPKISQFIYYRFVSTGNCSIELMKLLSQTFTRV